MTTDTATYLMDLAERTTNAVSESLAWTDDEAAIREALQQAYERGRKDAAADDGPRGLRVEGAGP